MCGLQVMLRQHTVSQEPGHIQVMHTVLKFENKSREKVTSKHLRELKKFPVLQDYFTRYLHFVQFLLTDNCLDESLIWNNPMLQFNTI
jgi:poly(A) polymerase Pap1